MTERKLSNGTVSRTATDGGGAGFGRAVPIQLPTLREVEKDTEGFVSTINKLTSPVFYSTTADGQVIQGLGGIPTTRPLLLIGNHQLFAADMYPMIQEFVQELGVLPRGLAHPVVFAGPDVLAEAGAQGGMAGGNRNPEDNQAGAMQFGSLLSTYGAVPVSGRNMHKLLEQGEMVLLYPGGAREVRPLVGAAGLGCHCLCQYFVTLSSCVVDTYNQCKCSSHCEVLLGRRPTCIKQCLMYSCRCHLFHCSQFCFNG